MQRKKASITDRCGKRGGLGKILEGQVCHTLPQLTPFPGLGLPSMFCSQRSLCSQSGVQLRAANSRRSGQLIRLEMCKGQWEASLVHEVRQVWVGAWQTQGI